MPELPEVEIIKQGLEKKILGLKLKQIEVLNPKTFQGDHKLALGAKVVKLWRRAKLLGIDLSNQLTLLFHLKMSGQIIYLSFIGGHPTKDMTGEMPNKSTRVILTFNDDSKLFFNDQRKFGWIKLMEQEVVAKDRFLQALGPEPLEPDFTWQILKSNLLKHKSQAVKVAMMDQTVVAGVGNIYASEACFLAKIDPRKKVKELSDHECSELKLGIVKALQTSIKHGGSIKDHLDFAYVYDLAGKPCKICQTPIKKITIGGRGTYFCESCQK